MPQPQKAYVAWSSGKDSAYALHLARRLGLVEIVGLLTTVDENQGRVTMHGVRESLLDRQVAALGLPCLKVRLPQPCPNTVYEARMQAATAQIKALGARHIVFGDLFLEDLRAYRDARLADAGMEGVCPLWRRDTRELARDMLATGLRACLSCVDTRRLDRRFAGRWFSADLLAELPPDVDCCGENGEFHTVVTAGPIFAEPIPVTVGEPVECDGFAVVDVVARDAAAPQI